MSVFGPQNGKCRWPGCTRIANDGYCRSHQGVHARATSDGVSSPGVRKLTDAQVDEARRMRAAFKTQTEIARHFGVTPETLRRYLRRP